MSEPARNISHKRPTINLVQKDKYKQFKSKKEKSPFKVVEGTINDENSSNKKIELLDIRKSLMVLRALNHKLRQTIINLIQENDSLTVTEIFVTLRMEQSTVSQHLKILRGAGIVNTVKTGKHIHYSINTARMKQLSDLTASIANH